MALTGYRATAERIDEGWIVHIAGLAAPTTATARDVSDVEPHARNHIAAATGKKPDDIDVEVAVHLDPTAQVHLNAARHYSALTNAECDAAITAMADQGVPLLDIARVIALYRPGLRPLTVTNAEIAEHGLERHPDAVGIEWDDHGLFRTRKCRRCVESTRREYRDFEPDGENALIYRPHGFACDFGEVHRSQAVTPTSSGIR